MVSNYNISYPDCSCKMRAHYFQHVSFEGLGSIEPWLISHGYAVTGTHFFDTAVLPKLSDLDLLIVMGGPMSVNDAHQLPWLVQEKQFIRKAIKAETPVLGICLGAQLIASALGAKVYPNPEKEIGWFPIHGVPGVDGSNFRFDPSLEVFHWHGETFELPPDAVLLARSAGCEHQAFQIGKHVMGLQFHLETTPASAQAITTHCRAELIPSRYVQSEGEIIATPPEMYSTINRIMASVLSFLTGISRTS